MGHGSDATASRHYAMTATDFKSIAPAVESAHIAKPSRSAIQPSL
jgi:hypothetical protein